MLLFARTRGLAEPEGDEEPLLPPLAPLALVALSERMRPDAARTVAYLHRAGVEVKIISGDGPATVAAVARAAGIETDGRVTTGAELPDEPSALRQSAIANTVFARVQPEHKRLLVAALRRGGRRVGMVGDGVNDVPALKECDVAVALGSGSQLAKGVADVVLVSESFEAIPFAIEEGRASCATSSAWPSCSSRSPCSPACSSSPSASAAAPIRSCRASSRSRRRSRSASRPSCWLSPRPHRRRPSAFMRDVAGFAIPAGVVLGFAVLLGHGLVHTSIGRSAQQSQTTSLTILVFVGLYLVLVLESGSMRRSRLRGALVPLLVGAARRELPGHPRAPRTCAMRSRSATPSGLPMVVERHLHDLRDRSARIARPLADAAGGEEVQVVPLLAPGEALTGSRVCDNRRFRGVAQPGSALRSGRRGPQFESGHPDALPGPQRGPGRRLPAAPRLLA